jgi:TRAP-type C4-dicarboxylate transport system permease small subunit
LKKLKKTTDIIEKIIGIYIPVVAFIFMFVSFCLQIISRYFLNHQFEWTYEYTLIGFIWTVVFGACFASKQKDHVSFSLIYDKFGPVGQAILTLIGNSLILIAFGILLYPAIDFVKFMGIKTTPVLKVPIDIVYAPFIFFIVMSIIYLIRDMVFAVLLIRRSCKKIEKEGV